MLHQQRERFFGLYPATFTPFDSKNRVKVEEIDAYAAFLAKEGVHAGAFISGTSGESMNLTVEERKAIASQWVISFAKYSTPKHKLRPIIHIGAACIEDAKALAAHADSIGVAGIAAMAPFFFKPKSVQALADVCAEIAAAAPNTPFLYYHYPDITGVTFPVHKFFTAALPKIPTLVGAKFTSVDMGDLAKCLTMEQGRFDMLNGYDVCLLAAASLGCKAGIGISYSYIGPVVKRIFDLVHTEQVESTGKVLQQAQALQFKVQNLFDVVEKYDSLGACFKELMKLKGFDFGHVRAPQKNLTAEQVAELHLAAQQLDFSL